MTAKYFLSSFLYSAVRPIIIIQLSFLTGCFPVAVLGKNIWGAWPLIIWEATTAKRNYYRTRKMGVGKIWGSVPPWPQS